MLVSPASLPDAAPGLLSCLWPLCLQTLELTSRLSCLFPKLISASGLISFKSSLNDKTHPCQVWGKLSLLVDLIRENCYKNCCGIRCGRLNWARRDIIAKARIPLSQITQGCLKCLSLSAEVTRHCGRALCKRRNQQLTQLDPKSKKHLVLQ